MPSLKRAINYIFYNRTQFLDSCIKNLGFLFPDKLYLSLRYRLCIGRWLNWEKPSTFTEKIQWLKINDYKPEYTQIVDKFAVKDIISAKIGKEYVIPTIGVWDKVEDIKWESLPEQFVLKTTHGGGGCGVVICDNKKAFDKERAIIKLSESMKSVVGKEYRERPYYNVTKRIIAETFIQNNQHELKDYKFFCSNGEVICFKIDFGRFTEHHANYYDVEGNLLPFGEKGLEPDYTKKNILPQNIGSMIAIAKELSLGYRFVRVDLYNIDGQIYFGELTLYPGGGMVPFTSNEWDKRLGERIKL